MLLAKDAPQIGDEELARRLVERGERLVQQQELGLEHEGAGERHSLRLTSGEGTGRAPGEAADGETFEPACHLRLDTLPRNTAEAQPHRHVREDSGVGQQRILEDARHAPSDAQALRGRHRLALKLHGAGVRSLEQTHDAEQGGLPRSVRADHGQHLTGPDDEMRHIENGLSRMGNANAGQLDDRGHDALSPAADPGRIWMEPRCMDSCHRRSRPISRIS